MSGYNELKEYRFQHITSVSTDHEKLNLLHDDIIERVVMKAVDEIKSEWGAPPTHFAFFMMGSAARFEQAIWSDQDHGIIFEHDSEQTQNYFLALGKEISFGLKEVGYELCDGQVMASNPRWCKSCEGWTQQINDWMDEESWESLRYLLTFFDSRVLVGQREYLSKVKTTIFERMTLNPHLLVRLLENVGHIKKTIGFFGQFLPEQYGEHTGSIQIKQSVLFPYVNAMRLLAIKEKIESPSTLSRMRKMPNYNDGMKHYDEEFSQLLQFRLRFLQHAKNYDDVHYLQLEKLSKEEKKELKRYVKGGRKLYDEAKRKIEKGCSTW